MAVKAGGRGWGHSARIMARTAAPSPPSYIPSTQFNDTRNSQLVALLADEL